MVENGLDDPIRLNDKGALAVARPKLTGLRRGLLKQTPVSRSKIGDVDDAATRLIRLVASIWSSASKTGWNIIRNYGICVNVAE